MPEVGVMHRFIIATPLMALLAYRAHHGFRFNARTHLAFVGLGICLLLNFCPFITALLCRLRSFGVAFAATSLINILLTA